MKYVLLIYQGKDYDPGALSKAEHQSVAQRYGAINELPNVRPGLPLGHVSDAVAVRVVNGETMANPGSAVEERGGSVGGYYEIEATDLEEAVRIAAQIPAASQGGAVEVRPSMTYW
jgi:hypothetical protein